jgi:uncharacterized protein (DUF1499 family)
VDRPAADLRGTALMVRRRISDDPMSRLAIWSRRFALFSLVACLLSIIIVRSGLLEIRPALATFAAAEGLAVLAILLAFGAFVVIWRQGLDGLRYAITALFISLALLAYPTYLGAKAYQLPPITDVTTDPNDPPRFDVIARLRPRETVDYKGQQMAQQQRTAYPDIEPLQVTVTAQEAYTAALAVVTKKRWRVVDERAPQAGRREGRIEAVVRTPIMGFRDDVVVRVRPLPDGARIDIRSASRYGEHDLGTNAARVRGLAEDIDDAVNALTPEKQERKPAAKPAQPARGAPAKR